jgi:hypothetical protein
MNRLLIILLLILSSTYAVTQQISPYTHSRILWDINTQKTIFSPGGYGRMIRLQNGTLMAVAQNGAKISISFSYNKGNSWSMPQAIVTNSANIVNAVPDLIQLSDGTILVGYNPRPVEPYSIDRKFGIRVIRSFDNGATWGNEIFIYDAQHTFNNGCWEPSFLELPSGEVQCYFANENDFQSSNEQNISMCRSFDKGLTWSLPVTVSFRENHRDGMPVPLLLKDKSEIVVAIEDNGYLGYSPKFQSTILRTTLADNWTNGYVNANSPNRELAYATPLPAGVNAAAPYIRQLPNGETILSYQGSEGRTNSSSDYQDMFVMVGTDEARNFKAKSTPFAISQDKHALWNSVSVIDSNTVVALTTTNLNSSFNEIQMIIGHPVNKITAKYGTITVDGEKSSGEKWTTANSEQLVLGNVSKSRWGVDFLYDNTYLYLFARVLDREVIKNQSTNDGLRLLLDANGVSSSKPQVGTFNIFFDANGSVKFQRGSGNDWITDTNTQDILYNINISENRYYIMEAAIPWSLLEKTGPEFINRMSLSVELLNRSASNYVIESIPDADRNIPYSWVEFELIPDTTSVLWETQEKNLITINQVGDMLHIISDIKIKKIFLYGIDGQKKFSLKTLENNVRIPFSVNFAIVQIILADNSFISQKILTINN